MRSLPGMGARYGEPSAVGEDDDEGDRRCRFSMAISVTDLLLVSFTGEALLATGLDARIWLRLSICCAAAVEEEEEEDDDDDDDDEEEENTEEDMRGEAEAGRRDRCPNSP